MRGIVFPVLVCALLFSCGGSREKKENAASPTRSVNVPAFNSDSAYYFVDRQVKFGPRIPNTLAHQQTGDYLIRKFKSYGGLVYVQDFEATSVDGQQLTLRNIIVSFNENKQKRILLAAHWDTRPYADKDATRKNTLFDGANDGASGVGVLMEIARQLGKTPASTGVDIILFDGEDWGEKDGAARGVPSWWCLGSQYWGKHRHKANYSAYYGILLDMVGARGAHFYREGESLRYAPKIVEKVWNTAERLGYSSYFVKQNEDGIEDDHVYVNELANIPMIDIVHYQPGLGYFGDFHHSLKDNMSLISKETLGVTGDVLMHVIYNEE